jgi:hypothetical protein
MKLTEAQQDILQRMQRNPNKIFTAEELQAQTSTLDALDRKGLVSGAFGLTATYGRRRGAWWKLTAKGKEV